MEYKDEAAGMQFPAALPSPDLSGFPVGLSYYAQIEPGCVITDRQGSLRSLTAFFFDRFAIGLRWAAAPENGIVAQALFSFPGSPAPFFASRLFYVIIASITPAQAMGLCRACGAAASQITPAACA